MYILLYFLSLLFCEYLGADTVTKKLGDNVNPSLLFYNTDVGTPSFSYTATKDGEIIMVIPFNAPIFSTTGTLLYDTDVSGREQSMQSYQRVKIVKLNTGQTISISCYSILHVFKLN